MDTDVDHGEKFMMLWIDVIKFVHHKKLFRYSPIYVYLHLF